MIIEKFLLTPFLIMIMIKNINSLPLGKFKIQHTDLYRPPPLGALKEQRPIPGGTLGLSAGGGVVSITTSVTTIYLCTIFVNLNPQVW